MAYIGKAPGFGIRDRYYYTATASQTSFSGADDNGQTLKYADSKYLDVYLNGVSLVAGTDYTATTGTSVVLTTGASADDILEFIAYDIFSVADTVSATSGGTFDGNVTFNGTATFTGGTSGAGGGYFQGDNGTVGTLSSLGDIFRVHEDALDTAVTIAANTNASATGPLTLNATVTVNGTLTIV